MYVIMCGGEYRTWQKPRQLLEINGEPIIQRTVRLLKENGVEPYISTNNEIFKQFAPLLKHNNRYIAGRQNNNGKWTDCFYPTDDPTCYIFGDVAFSPEAIETIVKTQTDDIEFFASSPPFDKRYIKPWAEPFALKVEDQEHLKRAIRETEEYYHQGKFKRKPIMWELWQVIKGTELNQIVPNYKIINDYTCDVDNPEDLIKLKKQIGE